MELKKIYDLTLKLKDAAITTRNWWQNGAASQTARQGTTLPNRTTAGGIASSVNSMTVHAGNVVVNGRTVNQSGSTAGQSNRNGAATSGTTARSGTNSPRPTAPSTLSKVGGSLKIGGGMAALTALFAAADIYTTRSANETRISETQAAYDQARAEYSTISTDSERVQELPQATQKLQQATSDLRTAQKEIIQRNNESFFGAVAGASVGADLGEEISKNFDYDVLGWLTGKNDRTAPTEKTVPQADWLTDSGKNYSELSTNEKIMYRQQESETERIRRESAESVVQQQVKQQKHDENMQMWQSGEFGDSALSSISKDDINATIEQNRHDKERKRTSFNQPLAGVKNLRVKILKLQLKMV